MGSLRRYPQCVYRCMDSNSPFFRRHRVSIVCAFTPVKQDLLVLVEYLRVKEACTLRDKRLAASQDISRQHLAPRDLKTRAWSWARLTMHFSI